MDITKSLQQAGLNNKQTTIYLANLGLGSAPAYKISKAAGLPRSTCYEILETLKAMGLVSSFQKRKAKYFTAEDPRILLKSAEGKVQILQGILPQLTLLYGQTKNRPTVRFFEGKEAIKIVLQEIFFEADEILGFSAPDDLVEVLGAAEVQKLVAQRVHNRVSYKAIMLDSPYARERLRKGVTELREVRMAATAFVHHSDIFIWKNKTAMLSLRDPITALIIESKELTQFHRSVFLSMWEGLAPLNKF